MFSKMLREYDLNKMGDTAAHMVIEGGKSGWKMGMDLISDYICLVALKDFNWFHI